LLAATVLMFVVHPAVSYGQDAAMVTVGFKFIADGKPMAAGEYELRINADTETFTLTPMPKGAGVFLNTVTRLAAAEPPGGDTRVVFDKVGDTCYLSEVWLAGEDGYLVYAAKGKHTHVSVKGHKKAK
jgi:hypothetical protein